MFSVLEEILNFVQPIVFDLPNMSLQIVVIFNITIITHLLKPQCLMEMMRLF